jgi:hypothetical protein
MYQRIRGHEEGHLFVAVSLVQRIELESHGRRDRETILGEELLLFWRKVHLVRAHHVRKVGFESVGRDAGRESHLRVSEGDGRSRSHDQIIIRNEVRVSCRRRGQSEELRPFGISVFGD